MEQLKKLEKTKKYHTVGTIKKTRKNKKNTTLSEQLKKLEKTKKYHTVGTIKKTRKKKYHTVGTIKPVDSCLVTDRETFYHKKKNHYAKSWNYWLLSDLTLYMSNTRMSYKKQELRTLHDHLSSPPVFWWGPCC